MVDRFNPDELLVCPYDPVHRVIRKRMQTHLVKCRKNYDTKEFSICPFNAKHVVPRPELKYHITHCEDRGRVEMEMFKVPVHKVKGNTSMPESNWNPPSSEEESWDDDNVKYVPKQSSELFDLQMGLANDMCTKPATAMPAPRKSYPTPQVRIPTNVGADTTVFNYSVSSTHRPITGVGRGRGRGIMSPNSKHTAGIRMPKSVGRGLYLASPKKEDLPPNLITDTNDVTGTMTKADGGVTTFNGVDTVSPDTNSSENNSVELKKNIRKLHKMLRQIELIEERKAKGESLEPEQISKLQRKQDVLDHLDKAVQQLNDTI